MAADDNKPILYSKIAFNGIKTKPGSVFVSKANQHTWILLKDSIRSSNSWDPSTISNLGDLPD